MSQVSQIASMNAAAQNVAAIGRAATAISSDTFAELLAAQLNSSLVRMASSQTEETSFLNTGTSDLVNLFMTGAMLDQAQSAATTAAQEEESVAAPAGYTSESSVANASVHRGLTITRVYSPDIPPSLASTEPPYTQTQQDSAISALTRLGDPYSQAKRGTGNYVDCSYLTQWAYAQNGVSLPGTAAEQARYCHENGFEVSRANLKSGDLIFWQRQGCTCGRYDEIHHVGIYLGDGRVVEASSSRGQVVVNDLWDGDGWQLAFCARPS